jgi:hypothetical protein
MVLVLAPPAPLALVVVVDVGPPEVSPPEHAATDASDPSNAKRRTGPVKAGAFWPSLGTMQASHLARQDDAGLKAATRLRSIRQRVSLAG